jgi:tetratricopeptide (TPR) repeat protein
MLITLIGCNKATVSPYGRLSTSLNQLMNELGNDQKNLQRKISERLTSAQSPIQPDLLLLQASMAVADDRLDLARQTINTLLTLSNLSDEQRGLTYLLKATTHYSLGQIVELDEALEQAMQSLNQVQDPMLLFWLEVHKVLMAAYRQNDDMFSQAVAYVLPRLDQAPNNLLGQSMLNTVAIGLTTGMRFNEAINVENIKVRRDEALGNIKGLSDSYYNLGTIYRRLLQPELALLNFMQCLEYSEQMDSDADQAFALQQMAAVASGLNDERAYEWAQQAHAMALSSETQQLYIPTKIVLAKVIIDKSPAESAKLLQEARALSERLDVVQFIDEIDSLEKKILNSQ